MARPVTVGAVLAVLLCVLTSCHSSSGDAAVAPGAVDPPPAPDGAVQGPAAPAVRPDRVEEIPGRFAIDTSLVVDRDVMVTARMSGVVDEIFVDRGSRVRKGDPLLKLINRDLALLLRRVEVSAKQKRADSERARKLFEERAISTAQFEAIGLELESAEVDVEIAREQLEKSWVRAPFDGLIIDRFARLGQRVVEEDNQPLFRITTLSPLQARLYVPEPVARALKRGDRVEVIPRYQAGEAVTGTVEWVSRVIDASSGTSQAIVSVPGGGARGALAPGDAVTVVVHVPPTAVDGP